MSAEGNKQVVLSFFEHFSAGNVEAALALMADTATWWVAGNPQHFALAGTKTKAQFAERKGNSNGLFAAPPARCGSPAGAARSRV